MNILHLAAGGGRREMMKMFMEKGLGSEPDHFRRTPMMLAIRNYQN
jgi:hypothetical protein